MANDWISTLGFEMKATWIKPGTVFSHEHFFLGEYKGQVPNQSELELLVKRHCFVDRNMTTLLLGYFGKR